MSLNKKQERLRIRMIRRIKILITGFILTASIGLVFVTIPSIANAATTGVSTSSLCDGASGSIGSVGAGNQSSTCAGGTQAVNTINNTTSFVINFISAIVGLIAIIMIIIGGIRYVTSGGNSEKTTAAKDTILFAVVGLIVVALAQVIVRFVLNKASGL